LPIEVAKASPLWVHGPFSSEFLAMAVTMSIEKMVVVSNPLGLHLRPADMLARAAARFQCMIEIEKDGQAIDGKSIMSILTLGAQQGTQLQLRAIGEDAPQAIEALSELFENGFEDSELTPDTSGEARPG
jgi:phosphotransferase system HPr (HPr) family protein